MLYSGGIQDQIGTEKRHRRLHMACEALAAEEELWKRVNKKHQSALGLSPGLEV